MIGKVFISSGTGIIGYLLITRVEQFSSKLNSPILPTTVLKKILLFFFDFLKLKKNYSDFLLILSIFELRRYFFIEYLFI